MKFLTSFLLTAVIFTSALYLLVIGVDPYNKLGNNWFGFETKAVDFARVNKFNQVEHARKDYIAFIMGSSSAHRYWTKEIDRLTGLTSYNYSTQSATPEDFLAMTRHILSKFHPRLLILSMDFEVLNKNTETDDMFYSSPLKDYLEEGKKKEEVSDLFKNSYMTLEAIGDSLKVIWVNKFEKAHHAYLEDGNHIVEPMPAQLEVKQFDSRPYVFDQKRLGYLRTIKELCDKNGVRVIVLTSPLAASHQELIEKNNLSGVHREFKRKLVEIFGAVWDFQDKTMIPFSSLEYFRDSNHPRHEFSTRILERIFGKVKTPGTLLTPESFSGK
jgi:hypothetical protein